VDLRYSPSDEEFREELRAWLADAVPAHGDPPSSNDWTARREYDTGWQRKLFDAGYAGINWPREYGGRDASLTEQLVYYEEIARARTPYVGVNFVGLLHGGPTLMAEGTPEQKARHIGAIIRGEQVWCQGFSEPSAGSDLAALKTRAERDGDVYVVNGHKIWTSFAQVADYCELLVRCPWTRTASRSARSPPSRARETSARSSWRTCASPSRIGSAPRTTAGGSRT
jgi:alkylation response protein AidB-like acyl-CoA dehydrogenase